MNSTNMSPLLQNRHVEQSHQQQSVKKGTQEIIRLINFESNFDSNSSEALKDSDMIQSRLQILFEQFKMNKQHNHENYKLMISIEKEHREEFQRFNTQIISLKKKVKVNNLECLATINPYFLKDIERDSRAEKFDY